MCVANVCLYTLVCLVKWGAGETLCIHYGLCMDLLLDNTISILMQWAVCSVYSEVWLRRCGGRHHPMVICKALSTQARDEESAATGSLLAAIIPQRCFQVGLESDGEVWTLSLTMWQLGAVSGWSNGLVNSGSWTFSSQLRAQPIVAIFAALMNVERCQEHGPVRDEVTSHHPAAEIVTDCSAQRHSELAVLIHWFSDSLCSDMRLVSRVVVDKSYKTHNWESLCLIVKIAPILDWPLPLHTLMWHRQHCVATATEMISR